MWSFDYIHVFFVYIFKSSHYLIFFICIFILLAAVCFCFLHAFLLLFVMLTNEFYPWESWKQLNGYVWELVLLQSFYLFIFRTTGIFIYSKHSLLMTETSTHHALCTWSFFPPPPTLFRILNVEPLWIGYRCYNYHLAPRGEQNINLESCFAGNRVYVCWMIIVVYF